MLQSNRVFIAGLFALTLLIGCQGETDTNKAKATFTSEANTLYDLENNLLPKNFGFKLKLKKGGSETIAVTGANLDIARDFFLLNQYFTRLPRYYAVQEYRDKIDAFLAEHSKFLKTKALERHYQKVRTFLNDWLAKEKAQYPNGTLPEKYDFEATKALQKQLIESEKEIKEAYKVEFIFGTPEVGNRLKFVVLLSDQFLPTGKKEAAKEALGKLKVSIENYLNTYGFDLCTDIGPQKIILIDKFVTEKDSNNRDHMKLVTDLYKQQSTLHSVGIRFQLKFSDKHLVDAVSVDETFQKQHESNHVFSTGMDRLQALEKFQKQLDTFLEHARNEIKSLYFEKRTELLIKLVDKLHGQAQADVLPMDPLRTEEGRRDFQLEKKKIEDLEHYLAFWHHIRFQEKKTETGDWVTTLSPRKVAIRSPSEYEKHLQELHKLYESFLDQYEESLVSPQRLKNRKDVLWKTYLDK